MCCWKCVKYSFYGILLYIVATIFVLFLAIEEPEKEVWNGLFWIIQLFVCINAVAKKFYAGKQRKMLYFILFLLRYTLYYKLLFNSLLILLMTALSLILFLPLLVILYKTASFIGLALLGGWSLSLVLPFGCNCGQSAIKCCYYGSVGFPLIIPQLICFMKLSNVALAPHNYSSLGRCNIIGSIGFVCGFTISHSFSFFGEIDVFRNYLSNIVLLS